MKVTEIRISNFCGTSFSWDFNFAIFFFQIAIIAKIKSCENK